MCIWFRSVEKSGLVQQEWGQGAERLDDGSRLRELPAASLRFPAKQAKVMFDVGWTK